MRDLKAVKAEIVELRKAKKGWMSLALRATQKELAKTLQTDERILCIAPGRVFEKRGLVAVTPRRVLFLGKRLFIGAVQSQIPLERITGIDQRTGLFTGQIAVRDGVTSTAVERMPKASVAAIAAAINAARDALPAGHSSEPPAGAGIGDGLQKLADLKAAGALTSDEFKKAKARLIG